MELCFFVHYEDEGRIFLLLCWNETNSARARDAADDGDAGLDVGGGEGGGGGGRGGGGVGCNLSADLGCETLSVGTTATDGDKETAGGLSICEEEGAGERDGGEEEGVGGCEGDVVDGGGGVDGHLTLEEELLYARDVRDIGGEDLRR